MTHHSNQNNIQCVSETKTAVSCKSLAQNGKYSKLNVRASLFGIKEYIFPLKMIYLF